MAMLWLIYEGILQHLTPISTLLIPPAKKLEYNYAILAKLGIGPEDLG
jgi:hypothetical protein